MKARKLIVDHFNRFLMSHYQEKEASLNLSNQNLTDDDMDRVAIFLQQNVNIINLNLEGNSITFRGIEKLGVVANIVYLNIAKNNLGCLDGDILNKCFPNIQYLDISNNEVNDIIIQQIANHVGLVTLIAECNVITSIGAEALSKNTRLKYLNLKDNNINGFAKSFEANTTLDYLDVSLNNLNDEDAHSLAMNKSISILQANNNNFSAKGIDLLKKKTSLVSCPALIFNTPPLISQKNIISKCDNKIFFKGPS